MPSEEVFLLKMVTNRSSVLVREGDCACCSFFKDVIRASNEAWKLSLSLEDKLIWKARALFLELNWKA